jgi:hypothetical protein
VNIFFERKEKEERREIIIKNLCCVDGHYIKALVTNATGCNPQK